MSTPTPNHLEPSDLGTKEYWEAAYTNELSNHASDPTDTGHVWFSESDAEGRVAAFLERLAEDDVDEPVNGHKDGTDGQEIRLSLASTSFLDLGTGNGSMLRTLREDGWRGEMLGIDYSEASVQLARKIEGTAAAELAREKSDDGTENENNGDSRSACGAHRETNRPVTRFETWDLIHGEYEDWLWRGGGAKDSNASSLVSSTNAMVATDVTAPSTTTSLETHLASSQMAQQPWDIVLDKGTFDAISLSGQTDEQGCRVVEAYRDRILPLLARHTGLLVITSCNWTEEELVGWFVRPDRNGSGRVEAERGGERAAEEDRLVMHGKVKYPRFMFGGKTGQTISTICFRRT